MKIKQKGGGAPLDTLHIWGYSHAPTLRCHKEGLKTVHWNFGTKLQRFDKLENCRLIGQHFLGLRRALRALNENDPK